MKRCREVRVRTEEGEKIFQASEGNSLELETESRWLKVMQRINWKDGRWDKEVIAVFPSKFVEYAEKKYE